MRKTIATVVIAAVATLGFASEVSASPTKKPPKGCTAALDAAEDLDSASSKVFQDTADFFREFQNDAEIASNAGASISAVTAFLTGLKQHRDDFSAKVTQTADEVKAARVRFVVAARKCRASK